MKIEICILVVSCYFTLITAKCPANSILNSVISPCNCNDFLNETTIVCGGNSTQNLRNFFILLSSGLNETEKHFTEFYFNNTAIHELPMNLFYDITFERIYIYRAYNLTKINTHAFVPTITHLKEISIYDTPIGGNTSDTNNVYDVINSMINIESVRLRNTSITSIPANAFNYLTKLNEVYFTANSHLKSIGNYAFYELNNLTYLTLSNNSLELLPEHALSFRNRNNVTLHIYIDYMSNLTTKTFSNATFTNVNRRYSLQLQSDPMLKYLDDTIFNTVLANGNDIYLYSTRFECDCKMFWLYANRVQYAPLVHSAYCTDGLSIFVDRQNYTTCSNGPLLKWFI